jgi:phosphoribosylamine--glycine ligase
MVKQVTVSIIKPVVDAMAAQGSPYKGVLYTGLIMTDRGPKVLEFNARFGDPETQVILPRLQTDLVDVMLASINGTLDRIKVNWSGDACVGVVLASGGYPGEYQTGHVISVSGQLEQDVNIFYAGAKKRSDGQVVTDGGRVLTVAAMGKTLKDAREKVYRNIPHINFQGMHYRTDIAAREVN